MNWSLEGIQTVTGQFETDCCMQSMLFVAGKEKEVRFEFKNAFGNSEVHKMLLLCAVTLWDYYIGILIFSKFFLSKVFESF